MVQEVETSVQVLPRSVHVTMLNSSRAPVVRSCISPNAIRARATPIGD